LRITSHYGKDVHNIKHLKILTPEGDGIFVKGVVLCGGEKGTPEQVTGNSAMKRGFLLGHNGEIGITRTHGDDYGGGRQRDHEI